MEKYLKGLLDPFDSESTQLKILDGREDLTAGIRFRSVGSVACDPDGVTWFALVPGFGNALAFFWDGLTVDLTPISFPSHVDTALNSANISLLRVVSVGLQLSLENSPDENEGYWEAIRVPFVALTENSTVGTYYGTVTPTSYTAFENIANYPSFQTGKLRDLHRFQFKLNSRNDDHEFLTPADFHDPSSDVIIIKVYGRRVVASPSVIRYNVVSNQEVVYADTTIMSRLMSKNERIDNIGKVLDKTDYLKPAVQIS